MSQFSRKKEKEILFIKCVLQKNSFFLFFSIFLILLRKDKVSSSGNDLDKK